MIVHQAKRYSVYFHIILFVIFFSFSSQVFSQEKTTNDLNSRITFQRLPAIFEYNNVECILRDYKGYMWFGTYDGLIRFDGRNLYEYKYNPEDSLSLSNNSVNTLFEDNMRNLWVGTSRGLCLYNRETDNFTHIGETQPQFGRLMTNYIAALCVDTDSNLWIGTFGDGINIYNHKNKSVYNIPNDTIKKTALKSNRITCIATDSANRIWIGSMDGLFLYLGKNKGFKHFQVEKNNPRSISHNLITHILTDVYGDIWVGTRGGGVNKILEEDGVFAFEHYTYQNSKKGLSNNIILSLASDKNGILWIGTENGGLNRLNPETGKVDVFRVEEGNDYSIVSNSIWSLFSDIEDRLWIGTGYKGINIIDDNYNKFESYRKNIVNKNSLPDNDVKDFSENKNGDIWIATDGGGICKFDPKTRTFSSFIANTDQNSPLSNNEVQTILCDKNDNIWIGTWAGGIDLLAQSGEKIRNYKLENSEGGGNNQVVNLMEDSKGRIWACTGGSGLFLFEKSKDKFVQVLSENPTQVLSLTSYVNSVLEDKQGKFWVSTLNGLEILNEQEDGSFNSVDFLRQLNYNPLSSLVIGSVFIDSKSRIWICSGDNGLCLFDKEAKTLKTFERKDGLLSNSLLGILEDSKENLWITSNKGLSKYNISTDSIENFTIDDGLNSNEFYTKSILKNRNGEFYIGGEEGFNTFYPDKIKHNSFIPPIYLSDLKINNVSVKIGKEKSPLKKHISETQRLVLSYKQSSFTIEFVSLNYTRPAKNQFTYILEGFDKSWNYIGNNNSATYTNIKPGNYIFKVKGSNNDGIWSNTPAQLSIVIKPPVWKTWWAFIIYFLVISGLTYFLLSTWNERLRIENELKVEQLAREREHDVNEANIQFFTNISHEFRTPLSLILGPLESLIRSTASTTKEKLKVIYRNAQRLLHLTNDLMDLRKLEEGKARLKVRNGDIVKFLNEVSSYFRVNAERRNIEYEVNADVDKLEGYVDFEKLETIVLNLLSNAFKFVQDEGHVMLSLNTLNSGMLNALLDSEKESVVHGDNFIKIEVTDNGPGIQHEDLPFVFDKFFQSRSQKQKKTQGTGIGLALTQGLVNLHKGFLKVYSEPHKETTFTLILPVDEYAYIQEEMVSSETGQVTTSTYIIPDDENLLQHREVLGAERGGNKSDLLIVEDNYELRNFLVKELSENYNVLQAEDGKEGITMATEKIPDLIVSDIIMPNISGIELCKSLKNEIKTSHIPIILLSAKSTVDDQIEGAETGADGYITKPFNMQLLHARIAQLIESRQKLYARFSQDVYIMPGKITENKIDQEFLQKAIDYIINNITNSNLNVEGLAEHMNLSRSNIYRKIKSLTGNTIVDFIRTIRMKEAVKLMETKKFTMAEIAYQTGFTSPSYFTKSFKDHFGKPPSEYVS